METRALIITCLLWSSVLCWETKDHSSDCELELVQVVYRHGDRNIITPYPNDPFANESFWPEGFGQLTKMGKWQQYELGKYLRGRYGGFLSDIYSPYEIRVQSSNVDRAIMSADANLAGLYPPVNNRSIWSEDIKWQPIPVHNLPEEMDNYLAMNASCPRYQTIFEDFKHNSEFMKKYNDENRELYEILSEYSGKNITNPKDVSYLRDDLFIERLYNFTMPDWVKKIYPKYEKQLEDVTAFSFKMITYTEEMKRLKGGPLVKELIKNINSKVDKSLDARRKFFMYSAHDTTIAALLNTLDVFDEHSPPYTAMVMLELHRNKTSGEYFVEILYKNSTGNPYILSLNGCQTPCLLNEFLNLTAKIIPGDWHKECLFSDYNFDTVGIVVGGLAAFIILGLVVCLGMSCVSCLKRKRESSLPPKYPYLHLQMEDGDEEA